MLSVSPPHSLTLISTWYVNGSAVIKLFFEG